MTTEFPKSTLKDTLRLPEALQRNGGQRLAAIDMASALSLSPGSSTIRTLGSSGTAYGMTTGSYKSGFAMGTLGERVTSPKDEQERSDALVQAALKPEAFRKAFELYKGKKYPEAQFMANTVRRELDVADKQAALFVQVFTDNARFVGLIRETKGGDWLVGDIPTGVSGLQTADTSTDRVSADTIRVGAEGSDDAGAIPIPKDLLDAGDDEGSREPRKRRPNKLFIGHGRNKRPVEQLTQTLRELGIPYVVAETEPNAARPISQKVRDVMDQCGAGILIFSADVEYFDGEGNSVWRPSENVSHELGAASVMYDNRVILFKEESVQLASNYSGIGYIEYEKDKLDAKTNDLLRELIALKILRLSVD